MGVDMGKMRKGYQDQQQGGDFLSFDPGETLVLVHPPCREDDEWEPTEGVNYVPVTVHYAVGKGNKMVVSLDPEANPIIEHPFVKRILKKRKIRLTGECPVAKELEKGDWTDDEADESRPQTRYLWGVTPLRFRSSASEEWRKLSGKPSVAFVGKQIYDGIMEAFFDNGDISDLDAAVLVRIVRKGKDRTTKYEVKGDPETLKKAFKVPTKLRAAIAKAMATEGDCDLFKIVGNLVRSPAEVQAIIAGVKTSDEPDDDWDDEEEETPKRTKKAAKKSKKKAAPPPEDDDEEEDEDDEEEEAPPPPPKKSKKKAAKKPPPPPEEDDEEDDEDDEEEEEEEEPAPPPKKSKKKASKKAAKKPEPEEDDEDDDLGLDDLESALDDLEDEDEDE